MKRLRIHDISIKHKMMFCYGLLVLVSILVLGAVFYSTMQKYIYEQASESYRQTLAQVVLNAEYKLNNYDRTLNQFVTDMPFVGAVSYPYKSPGDYSYAFLNTISKIFEVPKKDDSISQLILYKDNPTIPESGNSFIDISYAKEASWYPRFFQNTESYTINDYIALSKKKMWIVTDEINQPDYGLAGEKLATTEGLYVGIIKPVIYNHEKITGIFELVLNYSSIFGDLIAPGSLPGDHIIVADDQMGILYSSYEKEVSLQSKLPAALSSQIGSDPSGKFAMVQDGIQSMVLYQRGSDSNWLFLRVIPVDQLFAGAKAIRQLTITVAAVCLLVSLLLALMLARMIARRLSVFTEQMGRVENLELDIHVDIDGRDEIGAVARSYNRMLRKIRELVDQLTISQQTQKESELKALQTQINPHFLYNTLATIKWMAMDGQNQKTMGMVDHLATFYRLSLNKGLPLLAVRDEILHLQAYTEIQKIRLEERIDVVYEIEPGIGHYMTLKLILQPFVENAILHGAEKRKGTTTIVIRAYRRGEKMQFEVEDDGVGMSAPARAEHFSVEGGYGIRNVHERVRLQYGPEYGVFLQSKPGQGTKVTVVIPLVE
jgi:two-component system sensor histidine kinase YesM